MPAYLSDYGLSDFQCWAGMNILAYLLYHLASYGVWWLVFVGIVFSAARFTPLLCIPVAFLVIACLIYYIDFTWVQSEMQKPDWDGAPDLDMIFMFGVAVRVLIVNGLLLPVAVAAFFFRKRRRNGIDAPATP